MRQPCQGSMSFWSQLVAQSEGGGCGGGCRVVAMGEWVERGWGLAGYRETGIPGSWGSNGVCVLLRKVTDDVQDSRRGSRKDRQREIEVMAGGKYGR